MKNSKFLHKGLILLCLAVLLAATSVCRAGAREPASEEAVKAAILFNFIRFVEWPPSAVPGPATPSVMATIGRDALQERMVELAATAGLDARVRIRELDGIDQLAVARDGIQILYIARSAYQDMPRILELLCGRPVLTVCDDGCFVRRGGMMNFVLQNNRIRFDINLDAAERSGLKMSAKLFDLARVIVRDGVAREGR